METIQEKIKSIQAMGKIAHDLRARGKKVVLCHGVFDLLHPGHVRHFEAARREGDVLVVSVTPDRYVNRGPDRPIVPQDLRAETLASLALVDYVVINEWPTSVEVIQEIRPSVYVKGKDYKDASQDVTGGILNEERAVTAAGGRIVFTEEVTFSSSSFANSYFNIHSDEARSYLGGFRQRFSYENIIADLSKLAGCGVLVVGDAIIDEYHYCSGMGKSPKEDVIVTRYEGEETFAGGVLAAANHAASFCDRVDLVTCLGQNDTREDFVRSHLKKNVNASLFFQKNAPTIVKRRFVDQAYLRKLFEICFINGTPLSQEAEKEVFRHLDRILTDYDLVLVTDFGHGMMTPGLIDLVCRKARFLAVNAQTNSSNIGYNLITKYPRADYVCVDEPEIRLALQDRSSELEILIKRLASKLDASFLSITRGKGGCVVYSNGEGFFKIPAFTRSVVDTVGAGDAFLSVSAPCVAKGLPMEMVGFIGNAAGALKVRIVGNRSSIEKAPLLKYITTLLK